MERQWLETPKDNEEGSTETKKLTKSNRNKSINTETKEEQSIKTIKNKNENKKKTKKDKKESRKRVRRSKRIKTALKNFKIYYQNVRAPKSKLDSLQQMIEDYQPALVCIVETHMQR